MIQFKQIEGLAGWIASFATALASRPQSETIAVTNLADEAVVPHNLNSSDLFVRFMKNGREQQGFDFEPIDDGSIKVYLPILDGDENAFTGKIFLLKVA